MARIIVSLVLLLALIVATTALAVHVNGQPSARDALVVHADDLVAKKPWLESGPENACSEAPCLIINHLPDAVTVEITTYDPDLDSRELRLRSKVSLERGNGNLRLFAQHDPVPDMHDALVTNGVDLGQYRAEAVLYAVSGAFPLTDIKVELPYGVLPQFFFDGFAKIDAAMGKKTDVETLQRYAQIAASEVNSRFVLSSLQERARTSQIVNGSIQTLTYFVAAIAIFLTIFEIFDDRVQKFSDGLADLIPFTGFLGTLLGVAGGLGILGLSDVTNDVSKALALGKIGSSLSLAINTTICAIVVFGLVLVFQFTVRTLTTVDTVERIKNFAASRRRAKASAD